MRWGLLSLVWVVVLVCGMRVVGPGDLDSKDQPKTVSYTADMLENGRWVWPHDMMGRPATKPPMYNWLGAVCIGLIGSTSEFVMKLPSLLAGLMVIGMQFVFFGFIRRGDGVAVDPWGQAGLAYRPIYAAMSFVSCITVYSLIYTARPDMLLAGWLFVGWGCATLLMCGVSLSRGEQSLLMVVLWLSFAAAVLTKGPPAVLLLIYIVLAAGLSGHNVFKVMTRTGVWIGLPLAIGLVLVWFAAAMRVEGDYIRTELFSSEAQRVSNGAGLLERVKDVYKMPHYFLVRFLPWTPFLIYFLIKQGGRVKQLLWLRMSCLWMVMVLVFFSIPEFKRDDYLLPIYPVAAVVTGYYLAECVVGKARWLVPVLACGVVLALGADDLFFKAHLKARYGDHVKAFAGQIEQTVGEVSKVVFYKTGYHPLQAHLGRNQGCVEPEVEQVKTADWIVLPVAVEREAADRYPEIKLEKEMESATVPNVFEHRDAVLGLYRIVRLFDTKETAVDSDLMEDFAD